MVKKIQSQQGETLIETMVAIIIATLSVGLLLMGVTTSSSIGKTAKNETVNYDAAVAAAESKNTAYSTGMVTITETNPPAGSTATSSSAAITIYGGEGIYSYSLGASSAEPAAATEESAGA